MGKRLQAYALVRATGLVVSPFSGLHGAEPHQVLHVDKKTHSLGLNCGEWASCSQATFPTLVVLCMAFVLTDTCAWRLQPSGAVQQEVADGAGHRLLSSFSVLPHTAPILGLSTAPSAWKKLQSQISAGTLLIGCKALVWRVGPSAEFL